MLINRMPKRGNADISVRKTLHMERIHRRTLSRQFAEISTDRKYFLKKVEAALVKLNRSFARRYSTCTFKLALHAIQK